MNKRLFGLCIFFMLALAMLGFATKPSTPTSLVQVSDGLTILFPKNDYFVKDSNFTLHFHVHDSNDSIVNNESTVCVIHVYNYQGEHVLQHQMGFDGVDFEQAIGRNLSNRSGVWPLAVYCNYTGLQGSGPEYGFLSTYYEITVDGHEKDNPSSVALIVALMAVALLVGFFLLTSSLSLREDHEVMALGLFLLSFLSFTVSLNFGMIGVIKFLDSPDLQGLITTTNLIMIIVLMVLIFYFMIQFIKTVFDNIAKKKQERRGY